jgi:isopenicillin-N epimerase
MCLVGETIDYIASLHPKGWEGIFERNHALAVAARGVLCDKLSIERPVPDSMIGTMFTLPVGKLDFPEEIEKLGGVKRFRAAVKQHADFGAYALPYPADGQYLLRVSAHLYNNIGQYHALADAVAKVVQEYGGKSPALTVSSAPKIDK